MKLDASLLQRAVPPGSMRYFAWLYTPAAQRNFIAALFLIELELHDTAQAPHEVAHIRLQWWRDEINCLIAGKARHPATQVLQASTQGELDFQSLQEVVLSAAQELANATYETDAELNQYLRNGLGGLLRIAAQYAIQRAIEQATHKLTPTSIASMLATATQLGAFVRQAELMRDLRQDFHHGRLYLPLAVLDEQHIEYAALQADDWPPAFIELLMARSKRLLSSYKTLYEGLLATEKQVLRPLLVLGALHACILKNISLDPNARTRQRVELRPLQKQWVAWRAAVAAR